MNYVAAVSQRIDVWPKREEVRDSLDQKMINFLAACGILGFPIPNTIPSQSQLTSWLNHLKPDLLVISGGNDIGQNFDRDKTEKFLLQFAFEKKLKVLGICRGMQFMAVNAGTELVKVKEHVSLKHKIIGEISGIVNSFHDFGFYNAPEGYRVLARSEDNVVEAIQHSKLKWQGWMWHPEREKPFDINDIIRIRELVR